MKRRFLSIVLLLIMIISALPVPVSAEGYGLTTSDSCIEMIQDLEGYIQSPIWDAAQYSIGYGCSTAYAEKYGFSTEYLTEEEAHALLVLVLRDMETDLDRFLLQYRIDVNQYQYDALMSFTYNLGSKWMNPDSRLGSLLIEGNYTENELASAMGVYCHVGTGEDAKIEPHLVDRRIREIKLFLYGAYNLDDVEQKFCTLKYDAGEGTAETDVSFHLVGQPYGILFDAEPPEGENTYIYFAGWYTASGELITERTIVTQSETVYAKWSDTPVELQQEAADVFTDLAKDQWYYDYVNDLYNGGVINGYEDSTFRPERTVTTGEALKMILLAAGYAEQDFVTSHWASGYHYLALEEEIIVRGDITDLDVPISRAMMAKIAANALRLGRLYDTDVFTDTSDLYATILFDHGIIEGYEDGSFRPERSLTRAELSAIVWRIHNLYFGV